MRGVSGVFCVLAIGLVTACSPSTADTDHSVPPGEVSSVQAPQIHTCANPVLDVTDIGEKNTVFIAARLQPSGSGPDRELGEILLDSPVAGEITWDADSAWAQDDAAIRQLIEESVDLGGDSGLSSIDSFLQGNADSNVTLGYASQEMQSASLTVACESGLLVTGSVTYVWLDDYGIVPCDGRSVSPGATGGSSSAESIAAEAKVRFCPAGRA